MKVKCVSIYNEHTKKHETTSYWLSIGKEYIVLEILIHPQRNILYRLVGDNENKMPALYNANQFIVTSNKLPSRWEVNQLSNDAIVFSPRTWQQENFWEDCYDGEPAALEIYKREARIIFAEENSQ